MNHKEFLIAYAKRMNISEKEADQYLDGLLETMYNEFSKGESVTIKYLGRFYCRHSNSSGQKVFKFTPARKLRDILGWG